MLEINTIEKWFEDQSWKPFEFQKKTWKLFLDQKSGLVNAPTGSGKSYSLLVPILIAHQNQSLSEKKGVSAVWITPIRALAKEIKYSMERLCNDLQIDFSVEIRSGDTTQKIKSQQKTYLPNLLITTPESLHILMTQKNFSHLFRNIKSLVADEWHELLGSKRGVQLELALSKLRKLNPDFRTWGISATVGNLEQAMEVLLANVNPDKSFLVNSKIKKKIRVNPILPDSVEKFPWTGHLGLNLLDKVLPIIKKSSSTLIFTNTRAQSEIWYNELIEKAPELSGIAALHHSSLNKKVRSWVEDSLQAGTLKVVVCTSSLDLGVDFTPVETIIQVGGPKGISRFIQRAGRSGHQPGALSTIHFLPTHSLELLESAALRKAIEDNFIEKREPYIRSFDVLIQYLMTLAVGEGFHVRSTYEEIINTHSFRSVTPQEWERVVHFLKTGGDSLHSYDEFKKAIEGENGILTVADKKIIRRHKMSIGTIVSDGMINIKYKSGGYIGSVEEWFISRLKPGDVFGFAGKSLELVSFKQMTASVVKSKKKPKIIPSWQGGRLPISSNLSVLLREKLDEFISGEYNDIELKAIKPLLDFQNQKSHLPKKNECLAEFFKSEQGYHLLVYPFEGRAVNEGIASLIASRISKLSPISFSLAFNDYGFELLSDQKLDAASIITHDLFSTTHLFEDVQESINGTEMSRRRFRDIASISGLVFKGFPGANVKDKHLQSSSELFYKVFEEYDPNNLLLQQSIDESLNYQLEYERLRNALLRIQNQEIILTFPNKPTPFGFPIMVDRLREKLSSESLASRVQKMTLKFE